MSRAYLSVWHQYEAKYNTKYYKVFEDYFLETLPLWQDLVDTIYIVDNDWGFTEEDKKRFNDIKKEIVFIKQPEGKRGMGDIYTKEVFDQVKEDEILYMDNDCFIYDRKGVQSWFDLLGNHDSVLVFTLGDTLREAVFERFPKQKEMNKAGLNMNHMVITRRFLNNLRTWDMSEFRPFPIGTYIPELDYYTKEGDEGHFYCLFMYQLMASDWVEMPIEQDQGFKHIHWGSWSYLMLAWRQKDREQYENHLRTQPSERYLLVMDLFNCIDTKNKYTKEIKEVMFDLLKKDRRVGME